MAIGDLSMSEHRGSTDTIARLAEAGKSRRALLGRGLAALGLAVLAGDEEAAAGTRNNRQRRRKRQSRRRRRRQGGGNGPGGNDCFVCQNLNDGPFCKFTSIQDAIDDAQSRGVEAFTVCPGTYKEQITVGSSSDSALTIQAASSFPADTTIDADGDGPAITVARGVLDIEFANFTITGGKAAFGGGIVNRGFSTTINNCVITGNDTGAADDSGGGGIYNDGGNLTLSLTTVSDNHALDGQGGGILNTDGTLTLEESTQVTKNMADQGGGIFNQGGTVMISSSSSVTDNEPDNCVGTSACGA
jgi:hypothetical protein